MHAARKRGEQRSSRLAIRSLFTALFLLLLPLLFAPSARSQGWETIYSSTNSGSEGPALCLDASGNVYISIAEGANIRTVKYNNSGQQLWTALCPSTSLANKKGQPRIIAVDKSGNVYVGGSINTADIDASDYITIKYTSAGQQAWLNIYDGPINKNDGLADMALDSQGNVIVTGISYFTTGAGGQGAISSITTLKYDPAGLWILACCWLRAA